MIYCKCGCGREIKAQKHHKYYGVPQYIHGHYNRGKHLPCSEEKRIKISKSLMGNIPWNKGKIGLQTAWNKGLAWNEIIKKQISKTLQGHTSWNKGLKGFNKGHIVSKETRNKISLAQKGNKSINWKGGITGETERRINNFEWRELRKKIYKRDEWICQLCGKHCHDDIQCHHIIPFILTQDNSTNNLETLCNSCHLKKEFQFNYVL